MIRKSTEELWKIISEDYLDLWSENEISQFNHCETREAQRIFLQKMHKKLPDTPTKEYMYSVFVNRQCDLKKALTVMIRRM
ncbi:MAG: hypothetical protein PHS00_00445 [Candidatus Pacebacteria bacterium]|nr:hypothetical protein [Candidatus Paceibacterota bacterium]